MPLQGEVIEGHLDWFVVSTGKRWSLRQDGRFGQDAVVFLENGDFMIIYENDTPLWSGMISLTGTIQAGVDAEEWADFFERTPPLAAKLIKRVGWLDPRLPGLLTRRPT